MNRDNWLCLDCRKNTLENNEDYYFLQNRLWRRLVPREERHGMLCRACVERRLGRPLAPTDFRTGNDDESDPDDQPMREEDYGIIDLLTPEMLLAIDAAMIRSVSSRPRKAMTIVRHILEKSSAAVPGLPDWFYMDRIGDLVETGVLVVVAEGEDRRFDLITAAVGSSVSQ
jgi:hypothetical protein